MKSLSKKTVIGSIIFIIMAAASRLVTALPNFSVMEAIALFGGAYLSSRVLAFIVPLAALYLSDLFMNNTLLRPFFPDIEGIVWWSDYMIWNFLSMLIIVMLGMNLLTKVTPIRVMCSTILASTVFFVLTNFGVWLSSPLYTNDLSGLITCYTAALPFFQTSALGSLFFSTIFFGSFEMLRSNTFQKDVIVERA